MSHEAYARLNRLSLETTDPDRAYWHMRNVMSNSLKLCNNTATLNLLKKMMKIGIGTSEVEKYASIVNKQIVRKKNSRKFVMEAMKYKVQDAEWVVKRAEKRLFYSKIECSKVVRRKTIIGAEFERIIASECKGNWIILIQFYEHLCMDKARR